MGSNCFMLGCASICPEKLHSSKQSHSMCSFVFYVDLFNRSYLNAM